MCDGPQLVRYPGSVDDLEPVGLPHIYRAEPSPCKRVRSISDSIRPGTATFLLLATPYCKTEGLGHRGLL